MSIEVSARQSAFDNKAESATVVAAHIATPHGTCGASLILAVNVGMFGMVAAAAFAMVEIVVHLVS